MNKANLNAAILSISVDRNSSLSLQSQLLGAFRDLVHSNRLRPGDRLPASRVLAGELSVSRVTVTSVYDQLIAEGYFEGRRGSGVYVATDLPDFPVSSTPGRGEKAEELLPVLPIRAFATASPDLRLFPFQEWARLLDHAWRKPDPKLMDAPDPLGWGPLREAISSHLNVWRGIDCSASQIVITSGLVEAIELISGALLSVGDQVLVEEPGHKVLVNALKNNSLSVNLARVDDQGFSLKNAQSNVNRAKAVFVTPSRQFPLGMTMPLSRRLQLLSWAAERDGYIIEDDFDGEFRYQGQPLPAIMSLDQQNRVIYVGSFSKVLFPTHRLSFVVVPKNLIENLRTYLVATGPRASIVAQPALARFIAEGGFSTHLRRTRRIYHERQKLLLKCLSEFASQYLEAAPQAGGMHLVAYFKAENRQKNFDVAISNRIAQNGVNAAALSTYFTGEPDLQGLVLGYAGFDEQEIRDGFSIIANVLENQA